MKASVKYKVIYRHREKYSISEMCRFFGVSRSGYYGYVERMENPAKDLPLAEKIRECQAECKSTYGYRRVHIWLEKRGIHHNPKTVLRVMNKYSLLFVIRRKRYVKYGEALHRYPNLLNHNFTVDRPNQKWVASQILCKHQIAVENRTKVYGLAGWQCRPPYQQNKQETERMSRAAASAAVHLPLTCGPVSAIRGFFPRR